MSKPRILHVCHSYDPPFLDVARQYCALFPRDQWHITTVFLTGRTDPAIAARIGSDEVVFFEYPSSALRGLKRAAIRRMRQLVAGREFRFAIAHRYKALYICTHMPGLFTFGVQHRPGGYASWTRRWYVRRKQRQLALLGVSNDVRDDMRADVPDFPPERIETLYNRIDPQAARAALLSREQARSQLALPMDAYLFGTAGRLHPDKDQATLIRGFARFSAGADDALLVIMGKGRLEQSLKALAEQLGVAEKVRFLGMVPDARCYFAAFDSFVLSSDREPFGMVLLEAMIAGLPVLSAACGGATEVIGDTGFTFEFGRDQTLAEQLRVVHRLDPEQRSTVIARQLQRLEQLFTDDAVREVFWALPAVKKLMG